MVQDNIMRDESGQPVGVPGVETPNIVKDAQGTPVVPAGTETPGNAMPKDTLARPTPPPMPSQQPEVTQETTTQKAVEGTITYEELAAKKGFKSPDDLAKSYANLESQNSKVESTLADAMKARIESQPEEEVVPVEANTQEDALKIVRGEINKVVSKEMDAMQYQMYLLRNPSDDQFAAKAIEYVKDNPGIKWEVAFKAAKADSIGVVAKEQGRQEAQDTQVMKEQAQVVGSSVRESELGIQDVIKGIKEGTIPLAEAKKFINNLQPQQ